MTAVPQTIDADQPWDVTALAVLDALAEGDISPALAEAWLNYILEHVESGREIRFRTWPGDWIRK